MKLAKLSMRFNLLTVDMDRLRLGSDWEPPPTKIQYVWGQTLKFFGVIWRVLNGLLKGLGLKSWSALELYTFFAVGDISAEELASKLKPKEVEAFLTFHKEMKFSESKDGRGSKHSSAVIELRMLLAWSKPPREISFVLDKIDTFLARAGYRGYRERQG